MKDKKVVFMGTPDFAVPVLKNLIENTNVVLVVTQPDKKVGRHQTLEPTNFNVATKDHFYHNGGSVDNRHSIVEALVYNFDLLEQQINVDESIKSPSLFEMLI